MSGIRRAFILASAERYVVMAINFAMMPFLARLLGPEEFGISVIGLAALALAEAVREFGGSAYIIQEKELTQARLRTAFTIMAILTAIITAATFLFAGPLAAAYGMPGLEPFLYVTAFCFLIGPVVSPLNAIMRREMAFARVAGISVISAAVNAATLLSLAALGFSYMSFAWANLASSLTGMALSLVAMPVFAIFRPSLSEWRLLTNFGRYDTAAQIMVRLSEYLPYLVIGRLLSAEAVGLFQRGMTLCNLPRRVLLGALNTMALAAISSRVRDGASVKDTYLSALSHVTAVHWPSLVTLIILAHPIVAILLGAKWLEVTPLVQVMAGALLLAFSITLTYPTLVAAGHVRRAMLLNVIWIAAFAIIIFTAANISLTAVAWSLFLTSGVELGLAMFFLRRSIGITVEDMAGALWRSATIAAATAAGPLLLAIIAGGPSQLGIVEGLAGIALAGLGWLSGLRLTGHPLFNEIIMLGEKVVQRLRPAPALAGESEPSANAS